MKLSSINYCFKIFSFPAPQIEVTHCIAWRRSFSGDYINCNPEAGTLLNGGDLDCIQGCVGSFTPTSFRCTDFSVSED